jgi:hypothetical protein
MCYSAKIESILDEQFNVATVLMPKKYLRLMLSFG